jgi:tRNA-guanine transglycosylase
MSEFSFRVLKNDRASRARLGRIRTARGAIDTPYLVPVATCASVRALSSEDLLALGAQCALANTYHLALRPGAELIRKFGGLAGFMGFPRPFFTDSGGFQAFSLGAGKAHGVNKLGTIFPGRAEAAGESPVLAEVTEEGVRFRSVYDGSEHFLDAAGSMRLQSDLGADMIMAFDECTSPLADYEYTKRALERTHRWAEVSLREHDPRQALYGIVQGGWFRDLREASADFVSSRPFDGIAIGGSLGKSKDDMHEILDWVVPRLDRRPRHLLGIGGIDDLFLCVEKGIDTFDCVTPTRQARRGILYLSPASGGAPASNFRFQLRGARFKADESPIDPACACSTCRTYSRAYLRHLFLAHELTYFRLATIHNVHFVLDLMARIRRAIREDSLSALRREWLGT